ncbi:MAG: hypothetical protein RIS85_1057 [Pseudomonadota bacterium]
MQNGIERSTSGTSGGTTWVDRYLPNTAAQSDEGSESFLSLAVLRGILYRQRHILIGIVALALVAGVVITLLTKPTYSASATVQIVPGGSQILEGQELDRDIGSNEVVRYMQTQSTIITSRRLAYRVVDSLKLTERKDFLGEELIAGKPQGVSDAEWKKSLREIAAGMVQGGASVDVPFDNQIITIHYRSGSPENAALIANALADNYVSEESRRVLELNTYAVDYVNTKIAEVRAKLQEAELKTNAYAKANSLVGDTESAPTEKGETAISAPAITVTNLASINSTYMQARAKRIEAEQRWKAIAGVPASQLPEVQQNPSIVAMVTDRSKAATEMAQLRQRYGDNFPRIQELKDQIAALDSQINRASSDIKNSIRNSFEVAMRQEQALSGEVNKVSGETLGEQDRRVRYNLLNRDATALRTQLASLLDRYNQLSAAANINTDSSRKLDAAMVPGGPVSPNLFKNLLVALIVGLGLALGITVLLETFDDKLRSADDVERKLGYPLLGYTPVVDDGDLPDQTADPFSPLMESYSSIRTAIDFAHPGQSRVLLVTSSEPSEGKSITTSVLGSKYAQLGRKTLLIEADLRKPTLARHFSPKAAEKGIAEVLLGDADLASVLIPSGFEHLDVLPAGRAKVNPVELLSSQAMLEFIERCRKEYALIIFDSPPVMGLADAPLIGRIVDGVVFIVEANRTHFGQTKAALRRLRGAGANVLGIVLTKYRAAEAGYSYDQHYRYYSYGEKNT